MNHSNNYKINSASCNGHNIFQTIKPIFLLGDVWTRFYFKILLDVSKIKNMFLHGISDISILKES